MPCLETDVYTMVERRILAGLAALPEPEVFALFRDVVDGLEVHVAKIAIDFQVLTGTEPDTDMLREALEEFLSG